MMKRLIQRNAASHGVSASCFVLFRLTVSQEQTGTFRALNRIYVHAWQLASKRRKHVNSHLIECERAAGPEHRNDDVESELVFDHARRYMQENMSVRTHSVRKLLNFSASMTKRESENEAQFTASAPVSVNFFRKRVVRDRCAQTKRWRRVLRWGWVKLTKHVHKGETT